MKKQWSNSEQLNLIFDENRFNEKINEIIKLIKIDSEEEIDHECIQSLILKLDKIFEEYNFFFHTILF